MKRAAHFFTFKCVKGHITEKEFPLGTRLEGRDEIPCEACLMADEVETAYVVFISAQSSGDVSNVGSRS
jgi:hypothetical protein